MAITWRDNDGNVVKVTYTGLVSRGSQMVVERVMSDIYSEEYYALVWNPVTQQDEAVKIGSCFELWMGPRGTAEVDLAPEHAAVRTRLIAEAAAAHRAAEAARLVREAEERRVRIHNAVVYGKRMRVARGRKTPIGTEGVVFWIRDGRVGLDLTGNTDNKGRRTDVAWVDAAYLVNVDPLPEANALAA